MSRIYYYQRYADVVKNKYNILQDMSNPNWNTLMEALVTMAKEVIPRKEIQEKKRSGCWMKFT